MERGKGKACEIASFPTAHTIEGKLPPKPSAESWVKVKGASGTTDEVSCLTGTAVVVSVRRQPGGSSATAHLKGRADGRRRQLRNNMKVSETKKKIFGVHALLVGMEREMGKERATEMKRPSMNSG